MLILESVEYLIRSFYIIRPLFVHSYMRFRNIEDSLILKI